MSDHSFDAMPSQAKPLIADAPTPQAKPLIADAPTPQAKPHILPATNTVKMSSTSDLWAQDPAAQLESEARKLRKLEKLKKIQEGYLAGVADGVAVRDFAVFMHVSEEVLRESKWKVFTNKEGKSELVRG